MLTKKDFKKVAEILRLKNTTQLYHFDSLNNLKKDNTIKELLEDFIKWFSSENPNFDEQKFREAVLK